MRLRSRSTSAQRAPLGVWVNNAGVLAIAKGDKQNEAEVRRLVEINLLGTVWR